MPLLPVRTVRQYHLFFAAHKSHQSMPQHCRKLPGHCLFHFHQTFRWPVLYFPFVFLSERYCQQMQAFSPRILQAQWNKTWHWLVIQQQQTFFFILISSYNKFVSKKNSLQTYSFLVRQKDNSKHPFRRFFFNHAGSSILCLLVN